jgi:hypothetical protein
MAFLQRGTLKSFLLAARELLNKYLKTMVHENRRRADIVPSERRRWCLGWSSCWESRAVEIVLEV